MSNTRQSTTVGLFLLVVLLWGSTWIAIKLQLGTVEPAVSVAYRFLLAAGCMFLWCAIRRLPLGLSRRGHLWCALVGLLMYCVNYVFFYYSSEHLVSGLVSIVFALSVACNIFNGYLFLKRPVSRPVVLAAIAGVVGLSLVFSDQILSTRGSTGTLLGVALGLGGTLAFSFGNIAASKSQQAGLALVPATAWSMLYGGLITAIGCLVTGKAFTLELSWRYLGSLAYLAIFGSGIAFVAYLTMLHRIGPDRAAYATVVFPLVALGISTLFEGYRWTPLAFLGVALVLAANATILLGPGVLLARFTRAGRASDRT